MKPFTPDLICLVPRNYFIRCFDRIPDYDYGQAWQKELTDSVRLSPLLV